MILLETKNKNNGKLRVARMKVLGIKKHSPKIDEQEMFYCYPTTSNKNGTLMIRV